MSDEQVITRAQAAAFLKTLWPEGEHSYLANHTRTYFEAILGSMPTPLVLDGYNPTPDGFMSDFAEVLRQIADHLDSEIPPGARP